jgi:hypothetical protein
MKQLINVKEKVTKKNEEIVDLEEVDLSGDLEFKVNTYYVLCDSLIKELTTKNLAYDNVITK